MRTIALISLLSIHLLSNAQTVEIIPKPAMMQPGKGDFTINASTQIQLEGSGLETVARFLNDYLQKYYGFHLSVTSQIASGKPIVLNYERMDNPIPGAYRMEVNGKQVYIAGDNVEAVFYGIQTLIQLLPVKSSQSLVIPQLKIEDRPRFAYRGLHLDVGRHFFSVDYVKKYIDFIALQK
jgi:hexosaminidase